jgi:hypothetical protein
LLITLIFPADKGKWRAYQISVRSIIGMLTFTNLSFNLHGSACEHVPLPAES